MKDKRDYKVNEEKKNEFLIEIPHSNKKKKNIVADEICLNYWQFA